MNLIIIIIIPVMHDVQCIAIILFSQELDDNLAELTAEFERATAAKLKCQQEAEATANTISLANRLVGGLGSEKVRWAESVKKFKEDEKTLGTLLDRTPDYYMCTDITSEFS